MTFCNKEVAAMSEQVKSINKSIDNASKRSSNANIASLKRLQVPEDRILCAKDSQDSIDGEQSPLHNSDADQWGIVRSATKVVEELALDEYEQDPGQPPDPGQPSLPANHTARASFLLKWPSINKLLKDILAKQKIEHIDEFPVSQEQRRVPLLDSGRSEYVDAIMTGVAPHHSPGETTQSIIGAGLQDGFAYGSGSPDFDPETIRQCVQSFKDNVLNMHPILNPKEVDALITMFLDSLAGPEKRFKRKRVLPGGEQNDQFHGKRARLSRNITDALILSVLALGEVCLHTAKIPDWASNQSIPGLGYFTLAAQIFGGHLTGLTLRHVHVALFLGLYHGQLGRVLESYWYIHHAGSALQVILRPRLSRLKNLKENNLTPQSVGDNQVTFAFWTCLQLESDILAELPIPHSAILMYEEEMPFPDLSQQVNTGYGSSILSSYQAQIWARKQLNQLHTQLYAFVVPDDGPVKRNTPQLLEKMGKKWIPPEFEFFDNGEPAQDLLSARLRDRWWGFQTLLYRQYIDAILHDQNSSFLRQDLHALDYARSGITALVQSTKAYHGLKRGERILVSNSFLTAHAQWGNLLVLSACYKHNILQKYVDRSMLQDLFVRTIEYFEIIVDVGSALEQDLYILRGLYEKLEFSRQT